MVALTGGSLAAAACGSRSTLDDMIYLLPASSGADSGDDGSAGDDATLGRDSAADAPGDRTTDTRHDVSVDAPPPPIDARPLPDVVITHCPDPNTEYIYVVTQQGDLLSFSPPTATFTRIGTLACPTRPQAVTTPYSMAVDRKGTAYVVYDDGELFRVSTLTARCTATAFVAPQASYRQFGMGFVGNANGATDTLFVTPSTTGVLATLDVATFQVGVVGALTVSQAELTGTGDGRLFAFYASGTSSAIEQLDPATATVVANSNLVNLPQGKGWAFGFWGGDFYLFTTPGATVVQSQVTRFRPSDGSQTLVASLSTTVVGAGVSTCAPQM
jgi:hypothetical protein